MPRLRLTLVSVTAVVACFQHQGCGGTRQAPGSRAGSQGHCRGRRLLGGNNLTLARHCQAPIQALLDLYTGAGVAKPSPLRDVLVQYM